MHSYPLAKNIHIIAEKQLLHAFSYAPPHKNAHILFSPLSWHLYIYLQTKLHIPSVWNIHTWTLTNALISNHTHTHGRIYVQTYIHLYRILYKELHTDSCTTLPINVFKIARTPIATLSYSPTHICTNTPE